VTATSSAPERSGEAIPGRNRLQATYDELRHAIVQGRFRPNERLIEADLAEVFSVSRTPVRESLQRLAAEGLVAPARRGWVVRELTLDEIRQIYEVREALEGSAARLAAERATEAQLSAIQDMVARRPATLPTSDQREGIVFDNDAYHAAILVACGNDRLIEQINRNNDYYFNVRVASLYTDEEMVASARQHAELAAAIAHRDGDAAEQVMRAHIREALRVIAKYAN
jgi:DNA-binding GntR family transcriptional regulator